MSIKDFIKKKMSKTVRNILDQILHLLWAFIALVPVMIFGPTVIAGACSGLLLALPRELVDQWPINHWSNTILDLAFFALGGAIAGAIF